MREAFPSLPFGSPALETIRDNNRESLLSPQHQKLTASQLSLLSISSSTYQIQQPQQQPPISTTISSAGSVSGICNIGQGLAANPNQHNTLDQTVREDTSAPRIIELERDSGVSLDSSEGIHKTSIN